MINPGAKVIQVDTEAKAIARNRPADVAVIGDARTTATKLIEALEQRGHEATGFRTPETQRQIASRRWRDEPYEDASTDEWIDPRTASIALNDLLPENKAVAVDSGHFLGYPAMFLDVPDARSWLFPNGFQAVGLGLGNAIGAAIGVSSEPRPASSVVMMPYISPERIGRDTVIRRCCPCWLVMR